MKGAGYKLSHIRQMRGPKVRSRASPLLDISKPLALGCDRARVDVSGQVGGQDPNAENETECDAPRKTSSFHPAYTSSSWINGPVSAFDVQVRPWRSCRTRAPRFLTILSRRRDACQGFESNPSGADTPGMKPDEIPWTNVLCGKKA